MGQRVGRQGGLVVIRDNRYLWPAGQFKEHGVCACASPSAKAPGEGCHRGVALRPPSFKRSVFGKSCNGHGLPLGPMRYGSTSHSLTTFAKSLKSLKNCINSVSFFLPKTPGVFTSSDGGSCFGVMGLLRRRLRNFFLSFSGRRAAVCHRVIVAIAFAKTTMVKIWKEYSSQNGLATTPITATSSNHNSDRRG
jgi:hypothetical protein